MKGREFINSKWVKKGATKRGQNYVKNNFGKWVLKVSNTGLIVRSKQLYQFFVSSDITGMQKTLVAGALIYVIFPFDIIPDVMPVVGWLDDLGVANFALGYIFSEMDKLEAEKLSEEQDVPTCSSEELLEKEIDWTSPDSESILKNHSTDSATVEDDRANEIKNNETEPEKNGNDHSC